MSVFFATYSLASTGSALRKLSKFFTLTLLYRTANATSLFSRASVSSATLFSFVALLMAHSTCRETHQSITPCPVSAGKACHERKDNGQHSLYKFAVAPQTYDGLLVAGLQHMLHTTPCA